MKKLLLTASALMLGVAAAMAVPAKPGVKKMLTLKDGTRVEATLRGDEHVHYYQTADGRALQLAEGGYVFVNRDSLVKVHRERLNESNRLRAKRSTKGVRKATYRGQRKGLVIMVEFSDVKFTYDRNTFNDFFNKTGYTDNDMAGSVHDYFLEQSYGQFDLEFDIVGPVTLNYPASYYGYDMTTKTSHNDRVAAMVNTVCKEVDSQVDYSQYDWNSDGYVDQVYVIYAGYSAAQGADHTIWPHEWNVRAGVSSPYRTAEGPTIGTYGISCELMGDGARSKGHIDGIGTSCHEFSHCLGLPDFYDTTEEGDNFGMSSWDLMDNGCYNGQVNGAAPCGYTAYERWYAGWLEPVELKSSQQIVDMPAIQDEPVAYVLYNDAYHDEYYLLENYQKKGFDSAGGGHGLLVLHVDYDRNSWNRNTVNNDDNHQRMTIIAADNTYTGKTLSADPFPGTKNKRQLTNTSVPKASLYNENLDGTKLMSKPITDIVEVGGLVTFNVMGGVEIDAPLVHEASNVSTTGFTASWDAVNTATDYTLCVTQTISWENIESFALFEEDFEKFRSTMQGSTDLATTLDEYTSIPGWGGGRLYTSPNKLRVGKKNITGELLSPEFSAPLHDSIAILIAPISTASKMASTTDTLQLRIYAPDMGGGYLYVTLWDYPKASDENAGEGWVIPTEWPYGRMQIGVYPSSSSSGVYMDYLSLIDGSYDYEEEEQAPKAARKARKSVRLNPKGLEWHSVGLPESLPKRRAPQVTTMLYNTTDTRYVFTDLPAATYTYKVRANAENGVSPWSDEVAVDLTVSVQGIKADTRQTTDSETYFDLSGRQVTKPEKGIYIHKGKVVVVR